ncbi:TolC family protein [Paucibacter sp. R3-3]|uniref:TolC family protein n=1 Tax=Roseateles agri TaxID=3098619 RepID=A0ABU5DJW1_9BURK|nr:TolC family protein [Paucibacter sp. R3-3]MDY0745995.1 TolC family protein [Paucibacter sp. R3-3]
MRKHFLWPLGLAVACIGTFASPVSVRAQADGARPPLTLEAAFDRALSRSPALSAAAKEVEAQQAAVRQAGVRPNPSLSATVEDTRPETRTSTLTLDIPLEMGGKRAARLGAAERAVGVASAELDNLRAELRARTIGAFFGVLVAQQGVELAAGSVSLAERAADAVSKRVAAGKVSPVEATRARVDVANARLERDEAAAELQNARVRLATVMGEDAPDFDAVRGETAAPLRPALPELMAQLESSPQLRVGRLEAERRRALIEVERSKAQPDLTLSLGGKRDAAAGRSQAVIGFSIPLPLFDRNQGAILEASRRAAKADDELQAARLSLLAELQEASGRLSLARASLRTLEDAVLPAALEAYEAAGQGFDAGKFGFLEVIDAQRSLLQARSRALNTLAAAFQAAAAIDRITGR